MARRGGEQAWAWWRRFATIAFAWLLLTPLNLARAGADQPTAPGAVSWPDALAGSLQRLAAAGHVSGEVMIRRGEAVVFHETWGMHRAALEHRTA